MAKAEHISLKQMLKQSSEMKALRSAKVLTPEQFLDSLNTPILATSLYLMPTTGGFVAIQDPPVDPGKLCPSLIVTTLTKVPPICPTLFNDYRNCIDRQQAMTMLIKPGLTGLRKQRRFGVLQVIAKQASTNDLISALSWQNATTPIHRAALSLADYRSRNIPVSPYDPFQL